MLEKISPIDPESNFAQDIGLCSFSQAPRSSKLGRSEINSLYAAIRSRALRVTNSFTKMCGPSIAMHSGWGNGRSEISYRGAACFMGPITSNQSAQRDLIQLLSPTEKVIDALLKALSTPWWTESSIRMFFLVGNFLRR